MEGAMRLGGNIELFGTENLDGATMVVLKKMVGMFVRKFSDKGIERLAVSFGPDVNVEVVVQGNAYSSSASHDNLFFALDTALKEVQAKI